MALANAFAPEHPYSSHKILLEVPVGGSSIYTTGMRSWKSPDSTKKINAQRSSGSK